MRHQGLTQVFYSQVWFRELMEGLSRGGFHHLYGLSGSSLALFLAALSRPGGPPLLVVTGEEGGEVRLAEELLTFFPPSQVVVLPPRPTLTFSIYAASPEILNQRVSSLAAVLRGEARVVIAPVESAFQRLIPRSRLEAGIKTIKVGEMLQRDDLVSFLDDQGYRRSSLVEMEGEYSVRGGIVDLFLPGSEYPVRIELDDDRVDSLRLFRAQDQRSLKGIGELTLAPAREVLWGPEERERGRTGLITETQRVLPQLEARSPQAAREFRARTAEIMERLDTGAWTEGLETLWPFFYPEREALLDYFPFPPLVVWMEPAQLKGAWEALYRAETDSLTDLVEGGMAFPTQAQAYLSFPENLELLGGSPVLGLSALQQELEEPKARELYQVDIQGTPALGGKLDLLVKELQAWRRRRLAVVVMADSPERASSLRNALWDEGLEPIQLPDFDRPPAGGELAVSVGQLSHGFILAHPPLAVLTYADLFGTAKKRRPPRSFQEGEKIAVFTDLKPGDFVVHVQHGIGCYQGIETLTAAGVRQDYLMVQYHGQDRLYVPTDQVHLLQKYIGAEGKAPKLNRLGGNEWSRVKSRVKESVQDMAEELLALYASRVILQGTPFGPDTEWQQQFEGEFPFQETPDQLRAVAEIKQDMESPRPMDRLLCGDVGYGKTEVALRAAFKAVADGKQVAVLVPTTVLAQQHFYTFKERLASFPVEVAVLSRFRSLREQQRILQALAGGKIDLVVGTHRLLSADVKFKNLGLLIVDEEQRFGVVHKEKIKQLRQNVDVLTLTATPIPRTLQMALVGVRDLSLIETPPEDRYPVQTYVVERNPELIRLALRREINRGGQVFYVHNRVQSLNRIAGEVRQLVPEARVAVAHGQMKEDRLERVMLDFVAGEYDILVCTTIIENGLDIARVNTLVVEDADNMGLAQLYQLRGRVGRSDRVAYAYFTYRKDKILSEIARKRLSALREFTQLGSGFKIAMRDLELRGAGNLLGPEQHGHMVAVGFHLYCRLLEDAVNELKGKVPHPEPSLPVVDLGLDAYFPDNFVDDSGQKMDFYQRLAATRDLEGIKEIKEELEDRYGPLPPPAKNLLYLARIRDLAHQVQIDAISRQGDHLRVEFKPEAPFRGTDLMALTRIFARRLSFSSTRDTLSLELKITSWSPEQVLGAVNKLLRSLGEVAPSRGN